MGVSVILVGMGENGEGGEGWATHRSRRRSVGLSDIDSCLMLFLPPWDCRAKALQSVGRKMAECLARPNSCLLMFAYCTYGRGSLL